MSDQYQPTEYYDWPNREHGHFLHNPVNKHYEITSYDYVPYEYYGGDEIHSDNVVFRQSEYVTYDLTHIRMVNRSDIHMYDTSGISIFDSGMITQYTSAAPSARKFVVDQYGRVGIGMDHNGPHGGTDRKGLLTNRGEEPSFDLDVKGQVGVEDYIYHNDNTETYMLFGSDLSAHDVNIAGEIHTHYPDDQDEINFRVGGVDMLQMQTRDVFYAESGTTATGVQDHITFNKYQSDVDFIVRSVDEPNMLFIDSKNNRISIGDSEDAPQATLEIKNHPSSGAYNVPLVQMNNMDTDKQLLDINAQNINADVISVSANKLVTAHVMTVTADSLTTGDIYNVTADKLTTGSLYHATTTSSSKEQVSLFHLESTGDRGHDVFQTVLMDLNFDTTAGKGARALRIDSEQTTGKVVEIDAQRITSGIAMTVSATDMTTGKGFELGFDNRTTGTGMHIIDTSEVDAAGSLVKIEQIGDRSGLQPSTGIDINFDTTGNPNSRTIKIDTEQIDGTVIEVDATQIRTGKVLDIDAQRLMSGTGIELHMDLRTTGTGLHIHDDAVSDAAGALVKIEQDGDRSGTAASVGIDVNFDTTNNPNSRVLRIDSEQRDGTVVEIDATEITSGRVLAIDADNLTTGKGIELLMDTRTTGTGLHIHDDAISDHAGALVKIEQEGDRSGSAASHVVDINMDTTNNVNSRTIKIDTEQRDGVVVDVDATEITTGKVLSIDAQRLTTGKGIELTMNNRTTGTGVHVTDTSTTNTPGALMKLEQLGDRGGDQSNILLDLNVDTTNNPNSRTIRIDSEQKNGTVIEVDATPLTTGKALHIHTDTRTSGELIHLHDAGTSNTAGAMVKIEQDGDRSGNAATHVVDINMDTTNNPNSRTIKIDTEQRDGTVIEVDATEITTGRVLAIDADKLTSGKGIELLMDTRTTGTGLHIHDDAATDHAGSLVLIEQKGDRSGSQASRGMYLNFDTTNNVNSRAFIIDSEQRDGIVMELDASPLTTGKGIYLHTDNRTTGTGLHIVDDSGTDSAGRLVHIEQKGNRDGSQTSIGMEINFDTTANVNARALKIDSEQTTGKIFEIDGDKITSGTLFDMRSIDSITTGKVLDIHSNSSSASYRDLVFVHNDNTAATGVRALYVLNDAKADRDGTANVRGETVRFETTAADNNPLLELRNSNAATNTPPILNFIRSASNEANDMSIGTITFEGKDSGNVDTVYAAISARATDKDNATEAGEVSILVQATDSPSTLRNLLRVGKQENSGTTQQAEVVINEDQIDCDFRVETNTSNNALVVRGDGSEIVINENSRADHDFRVESNNSNRMFFVDTSLDYVEIKGPANDDTIIFDIIGNSNTGSAGASLFRVSPTDVVFNESSNDVNFRIEADTTDPTQSVTDIGTAEGAESEDHLVHDPQYAFFVDGSNGRVGLGTGTPNTTLHVAGSAHIEGDLWVKGVTNQVDTFVHVTSAMDITNKGTGPALTVTQNGAQPVVAFYDGNNAGSIQYPALYIENGDESGPGNVGIGTANPEYDLEVLKTGRNDQNTQIAVTTHSTGTHTSDIVLQKSRGTEDSPLTLNDNDIFGRMVFQGWNANAGAWNTGAMIHARVHGEAGTGSDTSDMPGELVFSTTANTSNAATEHMRIMSTGRIGIGNSATDPMNTVQIDHNGADFNNGILLVRNDTTIETNNWLGGIGFDGKDGNVPSSITEAAAYIGAYATETWSTGDKGAKLVFGVAFNDDDDDTATNQPMEIDNTGTVTIKGNHNGNRGLYVDNRHTSGNGSRNAALINLDISGEDAATTDRNHIGLQVDVDSSYTGGDTSNEGRLYGQYTTVTSSGDNDLVYGAYILGQTSGTEAGTLTQTSNLYGAYIQADQNRATLNANQFGVYALNTTDNQGNSGTVGITNSYAVFGKHRNAIDGIGGTTTAATAGYFHVECDEGTITTATGVRSRVDRDAGTIGTGYLFKGNFEGTIGNDSELTGTKWGIHIEGANRNAIEGHLHIGAVTSGSEKTYTTLYVDATDGIRVPVGTTDERPPNSSFGITATSPTNEQYLPKLGTIRYNTTQSTFEGFGAGNQWGSLGGVIDPDRDTYWTAVNDLDNLHNPGGSKYGTDEFDPNTTYPGDVDYLRAFTTGIKRFAITDTGLSRWYYKNSGTGTSASPYTYQTMLQVKTATGGVTIENPTASKTLMLRTTDVLTLSGENGIDITTAGKTIDMDAATLDIDTTGSVDIEAGGKVTIDGATGILLDSPTEVNENLTTREINGRETWYGTITVAGDANTFYPVSWYGGSQAEVVEIEIFRNYSETAPGSVWNPDTSTHPGALTFKCQVNFGGWGGVKYDVRVDDVREEYSTIIGNMGWFANKRGFAIWLRGGTAKYHVRINGRKVAPTVSYAAYDPGANQTGVAPIALANITPENVYDYRYQSGSNLRGTDVVLADQLVHEGDSDTYFQFHADNEARVVVGGTPRLNIQNVSPHAKVTGDLEVTGDLYVPAEIRHTGDDDTWISFSNNNEISFRTGDEDRCIITDADGVKIKEPSLTLQDCRFLWTVASNKNSGWAGTEITSPNGAYYDFRTTEDVDYDGRFIYAQITTRMRADQDTGGGFSWVVPDGTATGKNYLYYNQEGLFTVGGDDFNISADEATIQLKAPVGASVTPRYAEDLLDLTSAQWQSTVAEGGQVTMTGFDTSTYAVKGFANYDVITFDSSNSEGYPVRVGAAYYKYIGWAGNPVKTLATEGVNGTTTKYTAYGDNMTNNVARLYLTTQTGTKNIYSTDSSAWRFNVNTTIGNGNNLVLDAGTPTRAHYNASTNLSDAGDILFSGYNIVTSPTKHYQYRVKAQIYTSSANNTAGDQWLRIRVGDATDAYNAVEFKGDGSVRFRGDITAFDSGLTSDKRLKKNITTLDSKESLDKILNLRGVSFEWKDKDDGKEQLGLIAQEVEEQVPQVIKEAELLDKPDDGEYKHVSYEKLVPLLIESIKEQQSQIDVLKAEIEQLKSQ